MMERNLSSLKSNMGIDGKSTAKDELDAMEKNWIEENKKNPEMWPLEMDAGQWGENELASRF